MILIKRLWVTGYRSYEIGVFGQKDPKLTIIKYSLKNTITQALDDGLEWILTGGQLGIEQWTLEVAQSLKKEYPQLKTAMMLPFAQFGQQWNEQNQEVLANLKNLADFTGEVSNASYQSPTQLKNYQQFMLTHTDGALLVYDPDSTGKPTYDYEAINAYRNVHADYQFSQIDFYQLQDDADSFAENQRE